jgi:hypothetical protein
MDTESKFETFVLGTLFFIAIFCAGLMVGWIAMLMLFEIFNITSGSFYNMIAENFLPAQSILGLASLCSIWLYYFIGVVLKE